MTPFYIYFHLFHGIFFFLLVPVTTNVFQFTLYYPLPLFLAWISCYLMHMTVMSALEWWWKHYSKTTGNDTEGEVVPLRLNPVGSLYCLSQLSPRWNKVENGEMKDLDRQGHLKAWIQFWLYLVFFFFFQTYSNPIAFIPWPMLLSLSFPSAFVIHTFQSYRSRGRDYGE